MERTAQDLAAQMPEPATFVIDRDGVVRATFVDVDYRKRTEPAAILGALKELGTK